MSIVALKNAIVRLVTKKSDGDRAPLLTNGQSSEETYGAGSSHDEEDVTNQFADEENGKFGDQDHEHGHTLLGSVDPRVMSDLIIGLSDGLTVPFALTAGLSSLGDAKLVITGGLAELISGSISMGLGGYLGAKSESDYYRAAMKQEKRKFYNNMNMINHEIEDILLEMNPDFSDETIVSFIKDLQKNPELMVDFIIKFGRGLEEPAENRQLISALTIGGGYFGGGFIPLIPYFFVDQVRSGLILSIIIMSVTLFLFGYGKTAVSMSDSCSLNKKISEGFQMLLVGGAAAGSAWFMVRVIGN
ncbi:LAMI_0B05534g1_1 [Lachancea mirantina]|uniref:LAMI_0B05534g1_1 n=1 Tax=Lachancea mirantina TaxID=1230905 RepID=A0A1G4IW01_9SACH|nr:LAMI_0B05534g1_1 [Lachancea mirantina]